MITKWIKSKIFCEQYIKVLIYHLLLLKFSKMNVCGRINLIIIGTMDYIKGKICGWETNRGRAVDLKVTAFLEARGKKLFSE